MSRSTLQLGSQSAPSGIFLAPMFGVTDLPFRGLAHEHVEAMLSQHGAGLGLHDTRKHIGWYLETSGRAAETVQAWRRLCTDDDARRVLCGLDEFYDGTQEAAA